MNTDYIIGLLDEWIVGLAMTSNPFIHQSINPFIFSHAQS
jgi:hypothetical protein